MTVGQILETYAAYQQLYDVPPPIKNKSLSISDKDDIIGFLNELESALEQIKKEL